MREYTDILTIGMMQYIFNYEKIMAVYLSGKCNSEQEKELERYLEKLENIKKTLDATWIELTNGCD